MRDLWLPSTNLQGRLFSPALQGWGVMDGAPLQGHLVSLTAPLWA